MDSIHKFGSNKYKDENYVAKVILSRITLAGHTKQLIQIVWSKEKYLSPSQLSINSIDNFSLML